MEVAGTIFLLIPHTPVQKIRLDCGFQMLFSTQALLPFFPLNKISWKNFKILSGRIIANQVEAAPHPPQPYSLARQEDPRNRVGKLPPNPKYLFTDDEGIEAPVLTGEFTCPRSEISSTSNKARSPDDQFSYFSIVPPTAIWLSGQAFNL